MPAYPGLFRNTDASVVSMFTLTEFPATTLAEPGPVIAAHAGITPTNRTNSRALMKTMRPMRDMAPRPSLRVLPNRTVAPLSRM